MYAITNLIDENRAAIDEKIEKLQENKEALDGIEEKIEELVNNAAEEIKEQIGVMSYSATEEVTDLLQDLDLEYDSYAVSSTIEDAINENIWN